MPNVQIPPGLSESEDVDHDQTQGGTEGNPHGDSAASADVSSIQSSPDVDHDNTSGGTAGNPHASSASDNHGNAAHSASFETETGAQDRVDSHENKNNPHSASADTNHGNEAHAESYITSGEAPVQSVNERTGDVTVAEIPSGVITMWSGSTSNVPSGWTLCDGTDGTPDLQDRFVVGAGNQYSSDDTGGQDSVQLSENELPSHSHTGSTTDDGSHTHEVPAYNELTTANNVGPKESGADSSITTDSAGVHNHSLNINSTGGNGSHENRPPYYALAYIMKT